MLLLVTVFARTVIIHASSSQVFVSWQALPNTASSSDFLPQAGIDTIPAGSNSSTLSLRVLDDDFPEFTEVFGVHLITVEGGAALGTATAATVNILPSDDPNGAFGLCILWLKWGKNLPSCLITVFSSGSLQLEVEEPESNVPLAVTLLVQRNGGSTGVSQVDWSISRSDGQHQYW